MRQVYLLILLCLTIYVAGQSPALINYQGAARDAAGVPLVNRSIGIRFELRQGSSTGSLEFEENQVVITNQLGLFSTQIGLTKPNALAQVSWQGGDMFLVLQVDPDGGTAFTAMGSQQLVSVPYAINARQAQHVPSSYTANVLTIGGLTHTLSPPSVYAEGAGISITGTVISNTAPDQTVTIQPSGSNVQVTGTYPNFVIASTPSLSHSDGNLGISDGNVVNITPTVTFNSGVLTVGPSTNSTSIPTSPATSITATGASTINPAGPAFNLHVIPTSIAITTNVAAAAATTITTNNISINIPPPQYNPANGILTTGNATTNITPTLNFGTGLLTVGPPTNTISIPTSPATTLSATGAATLNPTGPGYSLHVIPTSIAITTNVAAAGATTITTNNISINIPPPQYNAANGILSQGNATTNITPTLSFASGILTVGPAGNTVPIPSTPATSLNVTGAASINPSGPGYSLHVYPASVAITTNVAAAGATVGSQNAITINMPPPQYNPANGILTTGNATTNITPSLTLVGNTLNVGPTGNFIAIPGPTVTGSGLASVSPTSGGLNFVVSVPLLVYNATTGVLSSGTNTTPIAPTLSITNNALSVGPASNSVSLSGISPWTANGGSVVLSTGTNYVGIGTNSPTELLQVGSFGSAQDNYINIKTMGGNQYKAGIKFNHFAANDGFQLESNEIVNRLDIIRHAGTSHTVMSFNRVNDNIGIGTTSPSASLHLAGTFRLEDGTEGASKVLTSDATGNASWQTLLLEPAWTTTGNAGTSVTTNFIGTTDGAPLAFRTNNTERMRITAAGVVGIGTVTPGGKFHVEVSNGRFRIFDFTPAGSTILLASYVGNTGLGPQERFAIAGSTAFSDIGLDGNSNFVVEMNDTPKLSIAQSNGFVGVGTATAATQLEVNGDISIPSSAKITFGTNGAGIGEWIRNASNGLGFFTSSLQRMQIDNNGYVGIGITSPLLKLDIVGTESLTSLSNFAGSPGASMRIFNTDQTSNNFSSLIFGTGASNGASYESAKIVAQHVNHTSGSVQGDLVFMTRRPANLIEGMRLTGHGNVGINTSAPTATLHVNGTTRLTDGTQGNGKVLTSDASGNASWQNFGGMTAGMVMAFAGPTANIPAGWMICDGSSLSRTTFSVLFAAIGTSWGTANLSSFNLPDMRGMFLRGVDDGQGNDPNSATRFANNASGNVGDNVGSQQGDQNLSHNHTIGGHGATDALTAAILGGVTGYVPGGTTFTSSNGGLEARPKNVYVYYIIRY